MPPTDGGRGQIAMGEQPFPEVFLGATTAGIAGCCHRQPVRPPRDVGGAGLRGRGSLALDAALKERHRRSGSRLSAVCAHHGWWTVLPDPDAGQAGGGAGLLRAGHPRQPRRGPTRHRRVDLRPARSAGGKRATGGRFRTQVITKACTADQPCTRSTSTPASSSTSIATRGRTR